MASNVSAHDRVKVRDHGRIESWSRALVGRTVFWVFVVEVVLVVVFGLLSENHVFWTKQSFQNMAIDGSSIVMLSAAVSLLLGAGEFDISMGANVILSSVVGGKIMTTISSNGEFGEYTHVGIGITCGFAACCATGLLMGIVNGLIVTVMKVNSFITTLGTLGIATGIAYVISGGEDLAYVPNQVQVHFGVNSAFDLVPYIALTAAVIVFIFWVIITWTRFGLYTLAIGSSREAARRAGLRVEWHLVKLFAIVGLVAGYVGFIDLARFATTNVGGHQTDALQAIAGTIIGGTGMFGGVVSIGGAVIGSMLAVILNSGLIIVGVQAFYQLIVIGVILILAVFIDQRRRARGT
jgi:ribose transport system permease protein